jgi:Zn-dependent protease with chaperone function
MEPLWDRVDRNRLKLLGFVLFFMVGSAAGFVVLFALPWFLLLLRVSDTSGELTVAFWNGMRNVGAAVAFAAGAWAAFAVARSERWLIARMGATLVPKGELLDTKFALKDMALAAGLRVAPALYSMPDSSTNAFVFAARRRRAVIGVTEGFTRKLTVDQQRAVFANLVARLASGDTIVSTGVTALMWPVHAWRAARMTAGDERPLGALEDGAAAEAGVPPQPNGYPGLGVVLYVFFAVGFALLAEVMAAGHRRSLLTAAEKADAEGMLLLKDPVAMLSALRRCIELNNVVPAAGEAFAELFYCWTGISSDDEDDPEWIRVARLREVLGVMGYEPDAIDSRTADLIGPPTAPRLDMPGPGASLRD